MSKITLRDQPKTGDKRQLFTPEQLEDGMPIARAAVFLGTTRRDRLTKASFALTGILRESGESTVSCVKRAWQHEDLSVLTPDWRGTVIWRNVDGVMVLVTGEPKEPLNFVKNINVDPSDLPDISQTYEKYETYADLGLTAIQPHEFATSNYLSEVGRWNRAVTLKLE